MDFINLSKIVSFALRHSPEEYNLVLDKDGWAEIGELILSIRIKHQEYVLVNYDSLLTMIESNEKKRHEIVGQKIRALYGHSTKEIIEKEIAEPPSFLYHGTSEQNVLLIKKDGIKKMNRQYVHLSSDITQALRVAIRKNTTPVLLKIRASDAALAGVKFYKEDNVWLCDFISGEFIEVET